jgi:hypothetical protein
LLDVLYTLTYDLWKEYDRLFQEEKDLYVRFNKFNRDQAKQDQKKIV